MKIMQRITRRVAPVAALALVLSGMLVVASGGAANASVTSITVKKNNVGLTAVSLPVSVAVTPPAGRTVRRIEGNLHVNGVSKGLVTIGTTGGAYTAFVSMSQYGTGRAQFRGVRVTYDDFSTADFTTASNGFFLRQQLQPQPGSIQRRGANVRSTVHVKYYNAAKGKSVPLRGKRVVVQFKQGNKKPKRLVRLKLNKKGKATFTRRVPRNSRLIVVVKPSPKIAGGKFRSRTKV